MIEMLDLLVLLVDVAGLCQIFFLKLKICQLLKTVCGIPNYITVDMTQLLGLSFH